MANKTINDLAALALASIASDDLFVLWDTSGAVSTKSKVADLFGDGTNRTLLTDVSGNVIVRQAGGTAATDEARIIHDGTTLFIRNRDNAAGTKFRFEDRSGASMIRGYTDGAGGDVVVNVDGTLAVLFDSPIYLYSAADDCGIRRAAAGVVKPIIGTSGNPGWFQNTGGWSRVASDVTNATATMANITGLSATVQAGRKYSGELVLFCDDSVAADGIQFDFDGGAATWTSFAAQGTITDTVSTRNLARTAAIATDMVDATTTGSALVVIKFSGVVNAAGTFIPRFSQAAHTSGTATITANSYMKLDDTP